MSISCRKIREYSSCFQSAFDGVNQYEAIFLNGPSARTEVLLNLNPPAIYFGLISSKFRKSLLSFKFISLSSPLIPLPATYFLNHSSLF
jgi:hypothetical protein